MQNAVIREANASSEDILSIINALEPVLLSVDPGHAIIACLSIVLTLQSPYISAEDLREGLKGASNWICLFLENKYSEREIAEETKKLVLN